MKFIFKSLLLVLSLSSLLVGCGEKTPEQIAAENKKNLEVAVKRAQVLMFEGKYDKSIEMLEETSRKCGDNPMLCELLAYSYIQANRGAQAAIFFEKSSDLSGGSNAQLLINAAKAYEQAGQFQSAIRAYEKYLKLKPRDMIAWKSLSNCLDKSEKFQDALNTYLEGLKKSERNPNTQEACEIGNLFVKVGNAVQARRWLEAALAATSEENKPTRRDILTGLVSVYLAQKETALLENAVAELDKIEPDYIKNKYPQLHAQLAEFRQKLKEAQEALQAQELKAAEEAQKLAEKQAQEKRIAEETAAKDAAAKSPEQAKDAATSDKDAAAGTVKDSAAETPKDAATEETKITEVEIKDETTLNDTGKSPLQKLVAKTYELIAEGKGAEASKTANLAVAEDRNSAEAWRALALAYDAEGRGFDSYMAAREAYVRNSDDINATLLYIRTASTVQNNEQFLNTLYRAKEKFPNNSEIMLGLARTYKLLNDKPNSKFFYNAFLNGTPKEHPLYEEVSAEFEEYIAADKK